MLNSKTRVTEGGRMEVKAAGATILGVVYRGGNESDFTENYVQ